MVLLFSSACITCAILFLLISPSSSVTSFLPPFEKKLRTSSHVTSSGERVVSSINWNRLKKEREETEENSNSLDLQETQEGEAFDKRSPLYLHLPDCRQGDFQRIQKKTNRKGLICPMFRDEEGFLAEFLAYYQMHGIDHVLLFNHGSSDKSLQEVQPWVDEGFATVLSNVTEMIETMPYREAIKRKGEFEYLMQGKAHLEKLCRKWGQANGFSYFFSVDIDEYLMPMEAGITVVDAMHEYTESTGRSIVDVSKLNFQSSPHSLEPVDLLTIEAYQIRMQVPNKMTYFKSVKSKVSLRLNHSSFSKEQRHFVVGCCNFHGCAPKIVGCRYGKNVTKPLFKGKNKNWNSPLVIMHYARSLEKYGLKGKTWKTSSGEQKYSDKYQVGGFQDRQLGVHYDNRAAMRYGCQLREHLKKKTGQDPFLRGGDFWLRNVIRNKTLAGSFEKDKEEDKASVLSADVFEYHGYYVHQPKT